MLPLFCIVFAFLYLKIHVFTCAVIPERLFTVIACRLTKVLYVKHRVELVGDWQALWGAIISLPAMNDEEFASRCIFDNGTLLKFFLRAKYKAVF